MREHFGKDKVMWALVELTAKDEKTGLTVLKPDVRKLCQGLLGPAPEDDDYERFDAETLEGAWLKAASENRFRKWPECAEILAAAREIKKGRGGNKKEDWVGKAMGLADAYVRRFMKCSRAGEMARQGGYSWGAESLRGGGGLGAGAVHGGEEGRGVHVGRAVRPREAGRRILPACESTG